MQTYIALSSLGGVSLGLGTARVVTSVLILLLLLLCATTEHREYGRGDDGLLLGLLLGGLLSSAGSLEGIWSATHQADIAVSDRRAHIISGRNKYFGVDGRLDRRF